MRNLVKEMSTVDVVYFICEMIVVYGIHIMCNYFFETKRRWLTIVGLLFFVIIDSLYYYSNAPSYVFIVASLLLYFIVSVLYSCGIQFKNFIIALLLLAFGICSELLSSFTVSIVLGKLYSGVDNENTLMAALVVARIVFFILILISISIIKQPRNRIISIADTIRFIALPVVSIAIVIYIFRLADFDKNSIMKTGSIQAVLAVLGIVFINIFTLWLLSRQYRINHVEYEMRTLKQTINMQQEYYNREMLQREKVSRMKHDYKNMLISVRAELERGDLNQALRAIDNQLGNVELNNLKLSHYYPLDAVVGYKFQVAVDKGIDIETEYMIEGIPTIKNEDLCIIIGNALDNAIEYLDSHKECNHLINVKVAYKKGIMNIQISNPVIDNVVIVDGNMMPSTKCECNHGYGLKSIKYIVEKYDGIIVLENVDNRFDCRMTIYC